jgi:molybdate transport system ATP-binding protein
LPGGGIRELGHLRLRVLAEVGGLRLRVGLEIGAAWTVVFGASGSGKSSLLRAICGVLEGADVASGMEGVATHRRGIAYAAQGGVLFPHLTLRENVGFAGVVRGEDTGALVEEAMELFELRAMGGRMPRDLSGGERQRVNLARAFAVPEAGLMLLDEPFNGIGRAQRGVLLGRMEETRARRGVKVVSVTHDVEEAFLLGAEVVRLEAGTVVAQGPAGVVLAAERMEMLGVLGG